MRPIAQPAIERGYIVLGREWKTGDVVELNLPMPVQADRRESQRQGRHRPARHPARAAGLLPGGLRPGRAARLTLSCRASAELKAEKVEDLLGGVVVVKGFAGTAPEPDWSDSLVSGCPRLNPGPDHGDSVLCLGQPQGRADEGLAAARRPRTPAVGGLETQAKVSMSYVSGNSQPWGINDGLEPKSSGEQPAALCHWWPH